MLRSLLLSILGELQSFFHVSSTLQTIAVNQDKGPHEAVDGPNNQQSAYRFQFHHVLHNTSQVRQKERTSNYEGHIYGAQCKLTMPACALEIY
jgi:hypothetical protein